MKTLLILLLFTGICFAGENDVAVVYKPDKTISVIYPIYKTMKAGETEAQFIERLRTDFGFQNYPHDIIDKKDLPSREYRDAWEGEKGKGISINQGKKAQKQKKEQDRISAENKLKALGLTSDEIETLKYK